jgi:phosphatidylserine/phosphatidylglycerophosphate/cardiolipin synthase-like enzyme
MMTPALRPLFAAVLSVALCPDASAQLAFTGSLTENFDTLPASGAPSLSGTATVGLQVPIPGLPSWQTSRIAGTGTANVTIQTAQLTGGRLYSYGTAGSTERALGALGSGTAAMAFGVALVNNTGAPIATLSLSFIREIWMLQSTTTANQYENRLAFAWGTASPDLTTENFLTSPLMNALPELDAVSPGALTLVLATNGDDPPRARDGNSEEFRTSVAAEISGLDWQPGQTLFLRWNDRDDGGFDAGFGIDDLTITTGPAGPATVPDLAIASLPPDRVRLTWPTRPGRFYDLQRSSNLTTWPASDTIPFESLGTQLSFTDQTRGQQFFRLMERSGPNPAADDGPLQDAQVEAFFSDIGTDGSKPDTILENAVLSLLDKAAPGSSVRAAIYTWDRQTMADAFVAAHQRGVDVRLIIGSDFPAVQSLISRLPAGHVIQCRNAAGELIGAMGGRINHNKFVLFSDLSGDAREVVLQSSANFTELQLSRNNNLLVFRNRPNLYMAYLRYWNDMATCLPDPAYYRSTGRTTPVTAWFFPRASGNGVTGTDDTILEILSGINTSAGGSIRIAMATWSNMRTAIASRLAALHSAGMDVAVLVNPSETATEVTSILESAGVPLRRYQPVHSKYMTIDAEWQGIRRQLVVTGSHNFTGPALNSNDEIILRLENPKLFDAFLIDWSRLFTSPLAQ